MRPSTAHFFGAEAVPFDFTISVTPILAHTVSQFSSKQGTHTVSVDQGAPSSIVWSVVGGPGVINSGQGTSTVTVTVTDSVQDDGVPGSAQFNVEVTVNGVTKNRNVTRTHEWVSSGGGGS